MKIIANYLPQFHRIPENDKWWGEGFTDWKSTREAIPLYEGHIQPKEPINDFYYDLSNIEHIRTQVDLAKKYNIYGFGIYHYWFNSDLHLLDKPPMLIRDNKDLDIHYLFIWDNSSWARTWTNKRFADSWINQEAVNEELCDTGMLAELVYGDEKDWECHFEYLLSFFEDERYIKFDNKPVFAIFNQNNEPKTLKKMINYWDKRAKECGYNGVYVLGKKNYQNINVTEHLLNYEPAQSALQPDNIIKKIYEKFKKYIYKDKSPLFYDYDRTWKIILRKAKKAMNKDEIYSAFIDFDDSPRRGINAKIMKGSSPQKFEKYLTELLKISKNQKKEYIFLTAWNEWGEGAYLEPDKLNGYGYLEAVRKAMVAVENEI